MHKHNNVCNGLKYSVLNSGKDPSTTGVSNSFYIITHFITTLRAMSSGPDQKNLINDQ